MCGVCEGENESLQHWAEILGVVFVPCNYINTPELIKKKNAGRWGAEPRAGAGLNSLAHFPYIRPQRGLCSVLSQQSLSPKESLRFYISVCGTGKGL